MNQSINTATAIMSGATVAASADAMLDLALIEDVEQAEVQLKRNGTPLPVFVTLAGPEHPKRKAYALQTQRKMRKQLSANGKFSLPDPLESEQEENDLLANCTLAWRGVAFNGAALECTRANVLMLLEDKKRAWFRAALKAAFDDGEAFIAGSASV